MNKANLSIPQEPAPDDIAKMLTEWIDPITEARRSQAIIFTRHPLEEQVPQAVT
jgi:hypothetical protein